MIKLFINKMFCAGVLILFGGTQFLYSQSSLARLRGVVTDANGAVVSDAEIKVKISGTEATSATVYSRENGEYSLELRSGVYNIVADKTKFGFSQSRRAPVRIRENSETIIDFRLFSRSSVLKNYIGVSEANGLDDLVSAPFNYEEIHTLVKNELPALIRYAEKVKTESGTEYLGSNVSTGEFSRGVEFTYDLFNVTADKITVIPGSRIVTAVGSVSVLHNGERRILGETLIFKFQAGRLEILKLRLGI